MGAHQKLQWDDLRRMKAVGLFTVREAEFAWMMLEPREGAEIALRRAMTDVDDGATAQGTVRLKPFETKVYRMD